jgi:hypothetical protein
MTRRNGRRLVDRQCSVGTSGKGSDFPTTGTGPPYGLSSMHWLNTVVVVIIAPLFLWGVRALSRQIEKLLPEGRFKRFMMKERGIRGRPTLDSLRRGLQ